MQSYHGQHRIGARCFREARLAANFSAAAKPVLWLSYNLQHTRAVARAVDSCSTKAMKVVIALALPAAALKPVPVTMSAQQGRRNFVIGGARAVQHSRLQEARGDNQHEN